MSEFFVTDCSNVDTSTNSRFSITTHASDSLSILGVHGDLDLMTVDQLSRAVDDALTSGSETLVIDLTATEFLAAVGLAALDYGRRRTEVTGGRFAVVAPGRATARPLNALRLEQELNVHRTVEDALTACGPGGPEVRPLNADVSGVHGLIRPA